MPRSRFIKQRQGNDCAIAAIATVVCKSYAEVRRICGPPGQGLEGHEMLWLIGHFGHWRLTVPRKRWTLKQWAKKHPLCVVSYGWIFDKAGHAVAIVDGKLFNPAHPDDTNMDRVVSAALIPA